MEETPRRHLSIGVYNEQCTGCVRCVRICPTEALRVRKGRVTLYGDRCISCGRCVEICPEEAIQVRAEGFSALERFAYRAAVIPASFPVQFSDSIDYATSKKALHCLGFDYIAEEAMVAGVAGRIIREYVEAHPDIRPVISSSSPAVLRLMQARFPSLLHNIACVPPSLSIIARHARDRVAGEKGCRPEEVGVYLIASCVSQVAEIYREDGLLRGLYNGAIPFNMAYSAVRAKMEKACTEKRKIDTYPEGLYWAVTDLEASAVGAGRLKTLSATGIRNVIDLLTIIENQQLANVDYVSLHSGLLGGVGDSLNVQNPFVAAGRIRDLLKNDGGSPVDEEAIYGRYAKPEKPMACLQPQPVMQLDGDMRSALEKIKRIQGIRSRLPGLDCSACGSPGCFALAEDIFFGRAKMEDCAIHVKNLFDEMPKH